MRKIKSIGLVLYAWLQKVVRVMLPTYLLLFLTKRRGQKKAPLTQEEAAVRLQRALRERIASKGSHATIVANRKHRFELVKRARKIAQYRGIASTPTRCFKKLNNETIYQERYIWLDFNENKFYWSKTNPVEGDGLPPAKPAPTPAPVAAPTSIETSFAAGVTTGLNSVTKAVASVTAATTATLAEPKEEMMPEVMKTEDQLAKANTKSLPIKNSVIAANFEDNVKITRNATDISGARFNICLDPNNIPPSVMGTSKLLLSMGSSVHTIELFIPECDSRKDGASYYAEVMKNCTLLSKSS